MRTFINSSSLFRVLFLFDIYFSGLSYAPLIMFLYLSFGLFVMVLIIFSFNSACVNATNQIINNNDPKRVIIIQRIIQKNPGFYSILSGSILETIYRSISFSFVNLLLFCISEIMRYVILSSVMSCSSSGLTSSGGVSMIEMVRVG